MSLSTSRHHANDRLRTATIVPLPKNAARRFRRETDETRGQILLFTGVRYERFADDADETGTLNRRFS